mgnify:CR=1 FL=1
MATRSKIRKEIIGGLDRSIEPFLSEAGFLRASALGFYRVRDNFVDQVTFDPNRNDGFYLHYFVNLTCTFYSNPFSGYYMGRRLHRSGDEGDLWRVSSSEDSLRTFAEVLETLKATIIPWFDEIDSIQRFFYEMEFFEEPMLKYDRVVTLILLDREDEARDLISNLRRTVSAATEINAGDNLKKIAIYDEIIEALDSGRFGELLQDRKKLNLEAGL